MIPPDRERMLVERAREAHLVEHCAARWLRRYPGTARRSDLLEAGNFALVAVVRDYDGALGGFDEFCRRRVDWAMLDTIRLEARHQRNDRAAQRASADLLSLYRAEPGATPPDCLRTLAEAVAAASFAALTEEALRGGEDDVVAREAYLIAHDVMHAALAAMPRPLRKLMVLVYCDLLSLKAAAEALGIHENTAQRQHLKALGEIRKQLERHEITHAPERAGGPRIALEVLRGGKGS